MIHPLKGLGVLAAVVCVLPAIATAGLQQITPSSSNITAAPGESLEITLNYSAETETLTGVGVQLYFDSSKLKLEEVSGIYANGKLAVDANAKPDSNNADGDTSTDRFINAAWFDLGGRWPGVSATPLPLYTARFTAVDFVGTSAIRLTGKPASRQDIALGSVTINGSGAGTGTSGGGDSDGENSSGDGSDGSTATDGDSGTTGDGGSDADAGTDTDTGTDGNNGGSDTGSGSSDTDGGAAGTGNGADTNTGADSGTATSSTQTLNLTTSQSSLFSGETMNVALKYSADSANLTGVGVQLYYDSSKLQLNQIGSVYAAGKLAADSQSKPDEKNEDNDLSTDKKINAAWFDLGGRWPGESISQPLTLYTARFTAAEFIGTTKINLTGRAASKQNLVVNSLLVTGRGSADDSGSNTGSGSGNADNNGTSGSDNSGGNTGMDGSNSDASGGSNTDNDTNTNTNTDSGGDTASGGTNVEGDSGVKDTTVGSKKKRGGSVSWLALIFLGLLGLFSRKFFRKETFS